MNRYKLIIALMFTAGFYAMAQISEPPPFDNFPPENTPTNLPVDGGASLLAAAGIGYAGRRLGINQWLLKLRKK